MRKTIVRILGMLCLVAVLLTGCGNENHGLSAKKPQDITVWHYYGGALATQFDELVDEFNNTVGRDMGIVVYAESKSSIGDLVSQLEASANKEVGAAEMPNIFHCYLDTAASLEGTVDLVHLDDYMTDEEKASYFADYVAEGTFGTDNAWKLFPVAKSTEVLMLNKTDWDKFAAETGVGTADLETWESLVTVAEKYYDWSGRKAFYGRDAFANYIIIGSMQLGKEIFQVSGDSVTLQYDRDVMKRLWDNFYVPYVKGYFTQVGRYRSDDIKLGEIIAQTCSTSSAAYFPAEVAAQDGSSYAIDYEVLPLPNFEGTQPYAVQQGANMAVTKSTEREEYASIVFLKWFTEKEQNLRFNLGSGYLPVKYDAAKPEAIESYCAENETKSVIRDTVDVALKQAEGSTLFTSKAFANGTAARDMLDTAMVSRAVEDRAVIEERVAKGEKRDAVLAEYLSEEYFEVWYQESLQNLQEICK